MRKTIKRITALICAAILVIGQCAVTSAEENVQEDYEVSLDESHVAWDDSSAYAYEINGQQHFYRDMYVGDSLAYCVDPDQFDFPHTMYDETILGNSGRDLLIKALLLLGPGGKYYTEQGAEGISIFGKGSWFIGGGASTARLDQLLIHFALGKVVHGSYSTKTSVDLVDFLEGLIGQVQSALQNDKSLLCANAKAAEGYFGYHSNAFPGLQNLVWLTYQPDVEFPGALKIVKKGAISCEYVEDNANYSLAGAQFVIYADFEKQNEVARLVTDANGETKYLEDLIAGIYYVEEIKPSKGYMLATGTVPVQVNAGEEKQIEIIEPVKGDPAGIEIVKVDRKNKPINFRGTRFTAIYSYPGNDGEEKTKTFVYQTDENGKINMSNPSYLIKELSDEPFYDELGTIQFFAGRITVKETKAPSGYYIDPDQQIDINLTVNEMGEIHRDVDYGNAENDSFKVYIINDESIDTFAYDNETGEQVASYGREVVINDKVMLYGAEGFDTVISGYPVFASSYEDEAGNVFRAGDMFPYDKEKSIDRIEGHAESNSEEYVLSYVIDSTSFAGAKICLVAEAAYGEESCIHNDLNDVDEIIAIPAVKTSAKDAETDSNMGSCSENEKITDEVCLAGLLPGLEYSLKGYAVSKNDEENVVSEVVERSFTAESENQTVRMEYEIDSRDLSGQTIVFFEELYLNGVLVGAHINIESDHQSIFYPSIKTTLTTQSDKGKAIVRGESAKLVDNVEFNNLQAGQTYVLKGVLMDKKKNEVLTAADGREFTEEIEFTPEETSGMQEVNFEITDTKKLPDEIVCFEYLYLNDSVLVASHEDVNSKEQTVLIEEPETPTPQTTTPPETTHPEEGPSPKTGDRSGLVKWIVIMSAMTVSIMALMITERRKELVKKKK